MLYFRLINIFFKGKEKEISFALELQKTGKKAKMLLTVLQKNGIPEDSFRSKIAEREGGITQCRYPPR